MDTTAPAAPPSESHSAPAGQTIAEAKARLASEGFNELATAKRRSPLRIVLDVLREPMLALLLVGGVVYSLLGSLAEALILLAFACMSIAITTVQQARTDRVLNALRDLSSPRALVIRDGARQRIAGREVVRGDLIVLSEGDRVPADAMLIEATDLSADESLLTGEAEAVRKQVGTASTEVRPGGHDLPQVFSGTLIVRGSALAEVAAIAAASEIGRIGKSLNQIVPETPHLQRQMRVLVLSTAGIGAGVSVFVVALYGLLRSGWLDAVLAGIAVGVAMLPEEFPMVLAVLMAMGAWRISKARVLTRRASAIEALGAACALCTDKTGSPAENRMSIAALRLTEGTAHKIAAEAALPPAFRELAAAGVMASAPDPFDPMAKAFHALAADPLRAGETLPGAGRTLIHSPPLSRDLLAMSQVWQAPGGFAIAAKGAPEAMAALCKLPADRRDAITVQLDTMARDGLRVLAVAEASWPPDRALPESQKAFDFRFLALVGLADPLRASVPAAAAECQAAGIRVIMITGDHPVAARAIAAAAGLPGDVVLTGDDLAAMADAELAVAVTTVTIFARILPEQKLRIVKALKAKGAVVAMTGDGVNDAPSLKAADIGVAMGERGADVAWEAASIVLRDDDFGSIVATVRLGRRIYDNLRKAMSFVLAVHVPIAGLALMPLLFGVPLLFGPVHIAFREMAIDPVCALAFEAEQEEEGVMRRPPRPADEPLFSWPTVIWSLLQGLMALGVAGSAAWFAPGLGLGPDQVRGLAFATLVFGVVALILIDRSNSNSILSALARPNRALAIVLPIVAVLLMTTLFRAPARGLLGFGVLEGVWLAVPPSAGIAVLFALEALKPLWRMVLRANERPAGPSAKCKAS